MEEKRLTPLKAIRAKCLECSGGSSNEVKLCPIDKCALYVYRSGHNPYLPKREISQEQIDRLRDMGFSRRSNDKTV